MWKAFAVFYCLLATFGVLLGGYIMAGRSVPMSTIGLGLASVAFVMAFATIPAGSDVGVTNLIWLVLGLALNYFSWLGVWRYGRRMAQQPAQAR
ncbi:MULTISPECIES: hypothetical protein [unclassified Ensifer]|jgi:hypothetical protein|uniref:hypothetical protein n=1 Tax=unclassified Ensifer TaxID=2633371 RepID=UPI000714BCD9|nr:MULTISPECIES: hypothetical protein [unclassified Ensifer]KQX60474.1 hypothetical protein ASD49_01595 [Ensifer sp. Root1298]KQX94176.1 hypothetical protein ASD41_01590 [Ensifer sp. Root1312]KRC29869.1 hypothetical protein ASE29_01595 [Ensifer sp. Root74]KRD66396.1 hypothetical protein ASE71_27575 [Ensifer sp. Root954]